MSASLNRHDRGLSLVPLLPWLLLAAALSVTLMVLGAGRGDRLLPALSAGSFAALLIGTGLGINAPLWSKPAIGTGTSVLKAGLRCNVWLAALVYAWGASALFAVYTLSDLAWRHAFQYAIGASLLAIGISIYGLWLGGTKSTGVPPIMLTIMHGTAVAAGLLFLVGTGKLATLKSDWAANEVFLWGGITILALCTISALTQWRASGS